MTGGLANNRQILKNYLLCCLELLRWLIDVIRTCVPDSFWWHQHCWWFGVSSCSWCQRALLALSGSSSDCGYRPGRDGVWRGECSIEIRTPLEFLLLPSHPGAIKVVQLLGAWHLLSVAISKLTRVLGLFFFLWECREAWVWDLLPALERAALWNPDVGLLGLVISLPLPSSLLPSFPFLVWDKGSPCNPGWPPAHRDLPSSNSACWD